MIVSSSKRRWTLFLGVALWLCVGWTSLAFGAVARPNVILVITDDQGYGDLGAHGNPVIQTPRLDDFTRHSARLAHFYVSPVCSPTRSSLLTGRYNYRTGVVDTYLGRSLMHPDEVTLAELLKSAGYRTGIFGKWHLGDNYPLRAMDQGFDEALVLKGGGIGQPSDPPGGSSYFDPILQHNGKPEQLKGYCSDVYTDAAIRFIEADGSKPFFAYLAFNAPHTPLQVAEEEVAPYRKASFAAKDFPAAGVPIEGPIDAELTAKIYGMVTNIDRNFGRLLDALDRRKLAQNTIVIFLTDNGPQQARFNAGMRGKKGTVYDGGIRVPCYIRWPGQVAEGRIVEPIAAHIDITPTLMEACGIEKPNDFRIDGKSLLPLLLGQDVPWPDRTLFFQWHRGDVPELNRACATRTERWKLVQPLGNGDRPDRSEFQLFDMAAAPFELEDVAARHPDVVKRLRGEYERWFQDVGATRNFAPPRILLGTAHENPLTLTRQDWRGPRASWNPDGLGFWEVEIPEGGNFEFTLSFGAAGASRACVMWRDVSLDQAVDPGAKECTLGPVALRPGAGKLHAELSVGDRTVGVQYLTVRRID